MYSLSALQVIYHAARVTSGGRGRGGTVKSASDGDKRLPERLYFWDSVHFCCMSQSPPQHAFSLLLNMTAQISGRVPIISAAKNSFAPHVHLFHAFML